MTCDVARSHGRNAQAGPMEGMPPLFHGEGEAGDAGGPGLAAPVAAISMAASWAAVALPPEAAQLAARLSCAGA